MTTLAQLVPPQPTIVRIGEGEGAADLRVFPLRLGTIGELMARNPLLIHAFTSKETQEIIAAIIHSGQSAVDDLIDAALRAESGWAETSCLSAFDEAEIIAACVKLTLPTSAERLGKLIADVRALADRFIIEQPAAKKTK